MTKERLFVTDVWKSTWLKDSIACYGYGNSGTWETYYVAKPKKDVGTLLLFSKTFPKPWLDGPFGVGI